MRLGARFAVPVLTGILFALFHNECFGLPFCDKLMSLGTAVTTFLFIVNLYYHSFTYGDNEEHRLENAKEKNGICNTEPELPGLEISKPEMEQEQKEKSDKSCQTKPLQLVKKTQNLLCKHNREMRVRRGRIRRLKMEYHNKYTKKRDAEHEQDQVLSDLQIKIPKLEREKKELEEERTAMEKQMDEETQRHQRLQEKYQKIHNLMKQSFSY